MAKLREISGYIMLRDAIKNKNKVKAQNLILNNVEVNNPRLKCNTPLHWAITRFEDLDIVTMLLDKGANIHAKNHNREKPLDLAIHNNRTKAATLLIKKGALVGENLKALIIKTIKQRNFIIFKNLINNGIQCNQNIDFEHLFKKAVSGGNPKILEKIILHCQFSELSEKYIPRELIMKPRFKKCVELLEKRNFTIHPTSHQDEDFVYEAVKNGNLSVVLQLLKLGANVNLVNTLSGLSLLKIACFKKHHEIVENLLQHNAVVNESTPTNKKILKTCYYYNFDQDINSFLLINNKKNLEGLTCLHIAVFNSDLRMTELLLQYDAEIVDDPTFFNITCNAIQHNCEQIVRLFLNYGVDIQAVDFKRRTLLHFCVDSHGDELDSRYNIAKLLLNQGATKQLWLSGNSLVFDAINNEHRKIANLFLSCHPNIQYISSHGNTSLHMAIEKDFKMWFIRALLKHNVPVNVINKNGHTPLMIACRTQSNKQLNIIKLLLKHKANINYGSQTPLHFICQYKSNFTTQIIELLLRHKANIEAVDSNGWTPLFKACHSKNNIVIKYLLDNNANVNHTDLENCTPLHIAVKQRNCQFETIKILLEHDVNVHYIDKQGKSVIHMIIEEDNVQLIETLAHTEINFNSIDKNGNTPLHYAVKEQSVCAIRKLIKFGADINILNKNNQTPLREVIELIADFENIDSDEEDWDFHNFEDDIDACREIVQILKTEVIKLKSAGLKVCKQNWNLDYDPDNNDEYFDQNNMNYQVNVLQLHVDCKREIGKMKEKYIGIKNMTFYDLLKKSIYFISRFVNNKIIDQTLQLEICDKEFPLYIDIMKSRIRDAKLRYKFMETVKKFFLLRVSQQLSADCIDAVFSYLNIEEIKLFIRAIEFSDNLSY